MEQTVDVAIVGAGSAGLYALGQVRRKTDSYVLTTNYQLQLSRNQSQKLLSGKFHGLITVVGIEPMNRLPDIGGAMESVENFNELERLPRQVFQPRLPQ